MKSFTVLAFVTMGLIPLASHAALPVPASKPLSEYIETVSLRLPPPKPGTRIPENQQSFDDMIDETIATEYISQDGIVLPPLTPRQKVFIETDSFTMIGGIPVPINKPLKIKTASGWVEAPKADDRNRVVIHYTGNNMDERTAGRPRPPNTEIERTQAKKRERLRETTDDSPFETAKLPRAQASSRFDPVIVFFEENSSELEVGQIDVLQNDVIRRLRQSRSARVAVYGYAERDRRNADRTHKLSLSRALLISEYLADNRIDPTRIEARAMADDTPISPKDRVDIVIY